MVLVVSSHHNYLHIGSLSLPYFLSVPVHGILQPLPEWRLVAPTQPLNLGTIRPAGAIPWVVVS